MFLFNIGLSHLINKCSLISIKNLLVPWSRMVKSSNEGSWLQSRWWSHIELSADGLTFLKVNGEIPMCFPDLKYNIFKQHKRPEIYLIFENYLDFTTT